MTHIITCDDHNIFLHGLKLLLEGNKKYQVINQYSSGKSLLGEVFKMDFDVLLLDINLVDSNGIELLKHIKSCKPASKVIMLSMHNDPSIAIRALQAGAHGYLHKNVDLDELSRAIDTVVAGNYYLLEETNQRMIQKIVMQRAAVDAPHAALSDRELEVLILLGEGASNSEVSQKLHLSPKTISTYKQRLLQKLQLSKPMQLFDYVRQHQLSSSLASVSGVNPM